MPRGHHGGGYNATLLQSASVNRTNAPRSPATTGDQTRGSSINDAVQQ
jgi:hypothetical protein